MKLETTLKIGIGSSLLALLALGAWAFWPEEEKQASTVEPAEEAEDSGPAAGSEVFHASVRQAGSRRAAHLDKAPVGDEPANAQGDSVMVETDAASLGASAWMEGQYDHAYVYTGPALSKEEQNAKKGIFTEATLRAREDELMAANPEMKEGIEAERAARQAELERYQKSGGLSVEEEAIQKGIQLED